VKLFRIAHPEFEAPFNGDGARLHGGRWNPKGVPLLYYASTLALAALEKRAHTPAAALGRLWRVIEIEVPDDKVATTASATLPANWREHPAPDATKEVGQQWAASLRSLALRVPSVIVPSELNVLVNPVHPHLRLASHVRTDDFRFDERLAL